MKKILPPPYNHVAGEEKFSFEEIFLKKLESLHWPNASEIWGDEIRFNSRVNLQEEPQYSPGKKYSRRIPKRNM